MNRLTSMRPKKRLGFLSPLYLFGVALHRSLYEWKIIVPFTPNQPTLAIGNLHVGGTGKTPVALWVLEKLQPHLPHIAYVSRGYGRKTKEALCVQLQDPVSQVGDEARMVRQHFGHSPDVSVVVAHQRKDAFALLPKDCPVILDDALQHWALCSQVTLLVCPHGKWYTDEQVLPAGPLREHPQAASRFSAVLISKCPYPMDAHERLAMVQKLGLHKEQKLFCAQEKMGEPQAQWNAPTWKGDETSLVFSGIGAAQDFEAFAEHPDRYPQGGVAAMTLRFPDHSPMDASRCQKIAEDAFQAGCNTLLTTRKDLARLTKKPEAWADLQVYVIPHEADFGEDEKPFLRWLESQWKAHGYRVPLPL